MIIWATVLLTVAAAGVCLAAMGVGSAALTQLLLALCSMGAFAGLIAWPFLRKKNNS